MTDLFHSAKIRLSRGKQHILDLDKRMNVFLNGKPYTVDSEPYLNEIQELQKLTLKFTKPTPDIFAAVAADAVDNMRAALDHVWFAIASKIIPPLNKATFPIVDTEAKFKRNISQWGYKFPKEILSILRAFQPYKGGNDLLWALHWICVKNKHRLVFPIGIITNIETIHITQTGGKARESRRLWMTTGKNEVIFYVSKDNIGIEYNINFSFDVTFDEAKAAYGYPVIEILHHFTDIVTGFLGAIETENHED